ncbi:hypothetical protein N7451_004286 [Penicillium sp. IBT 35674x]|nr:hypothetical protein N7451_004286 [Penicillium sp. IBT 35674x]
MSLSVRKLPGSIRSSLFQEHLLHCPTSEGMRQLEELAKSDTVRTGVRQLWMIPTVFEGLHDMDLDEFQHLFNINW